MGGPLPPLVIADSLGTRGCIDIALAMTKIAASTGNVLHHSMRLGPVLPVCACKDAIGSDLLRRQLFSGFGRWQAGPAVAAARPAPRLS